MDTIAWLYFIALILYLFIGIPFVMTSFICRIRCIDVYKCSNRKCKFRRYCDKYCESLTQEEIEALIRMLDSLD